MLKQTIVFLCAICVVVLGGCGASQWPLPDYPEKGFKTADPPNPLMELGTPIVVDGDGTMHYLSPISIAGATVEKEFAAHDLDGEYSFNSNVVLNLSGVFPNSRAGAEADLGRQFVFRARDMTYEHLYTDKKLEEIMGLITQRIEAWRSVRKGGEIKGLYLVETVVRVGRIELVAKEWDHELLELAATGAGVSVRGDSSAGKTLIKTYEEKPCLFYKTLPLEMQPGGAVTFSKTPAPPIRALTRKDPATEIMRIQNELVGKEVKMGEKLFSEADFQQYEKTLEKIIDDNPTHAKAYTILSQLYLANGEALKAKAQFLKVTSFDKKNHFAWSQIGVIEALAGNTEKAAEAFRTAIDIDDSIESYWLNLAKTLIVLKRFDQSRATLEKAIDRFSESSTLHTLLAQLYLINFHKVDEAGKLAKIALDLDPKNDTALFYMAVARSESAPEEAIELAEQALEINPNNLEPRKLIVALSIKTKAYKKGLDQIEIILADEGETADSLNSRATLNHLSGHYRDAINDAVKVIKQENASKETKASCINVLNHSTSMYAKKVTTPPFESLPAAIMNIKQFRDSLKEIQTLWPEGTPMHDQATQTIAQVDAIIAQLEGKQSAN